MSTKFLTPDFITEELLAMVKESLTPSEKSEMKRKLNDFMARTCFGTWEARIMAEKAFMIGLLSSKIDYDYTEDSNVSS